MVCCVCVCGFGEDWLVVEPFASGVLCVCVWDCCGFGEDWLVVEPFASGVLCVWDCCEGDQSILYKLLVHAIEM